MLFFFFYRELNVLKLVQTKSNIQICFCKQSKAFRVNTLWAVTFIIGFILYVNNPMNLNEYSEIYRKNENVNYIFCFQFYLDIGLIFFSNIEYPNESGRIDPKIYIEINLMFKNVNFVVISISFLFFVNT